MQRFEEFRMPPIMEMGRKVATRQFRFRPSQQPVRRGIRIDDAAGLRIDKDQRIAAL